MSRRVPRPRRTRKRDYRELAALLLPPAFLDPVVLPLLLCLLQLLILRPFPYRSCRRCRSSSVEYLFPALRRFFGPSRSQSPSCRSPRPAPLRTTKPTTWRWPRSTPEVGIRVRDAVRACTRLCGYMCVRANDAKIRRYDTR